MRLVFGILTASVVVFLVATGVEAKKSYVEIPTDVPTNGTVYEVSGLVPKMFVRTAEFVLTGKSCLQFSFRLLGPRVRLHAYTCNVEEGGFCTLDKYWYPSDKEGCTYLRAWTHKPQKFSFYFVLERRERKFRKPSRRLRRTPVRVSPDVLGELQLDGIMPCSEACGTPKSAKKFLGSYSDGTFGRHNRLQ